MAIGSPFLAGGGLRTLRVRWPPVRATLSEYVEVVAPPRLWQPGPGYKARGVVVQALFRAQRGAGLAGECLAIVR